MEAASKDSKDGHMRAPTEDKKVGGYRSRESCVRDYQLRVRARLWASCLEPRLLGKAYGHEG